LPNMNEINLQSAPILSRNEEFPNYFQHLDKGIVKKEMHSALKSILVCLEIPFIEPKDASFKRMGFSRSYI
jgi:hypothetical protein